VSNLVNKNVSVTVIQDSSQLIDLESGIKTAPWNLVQSKKRNNKKDINDRRNLEH
jgi:hypothetical protein